MDAERYAIVMRMQALWPKTLGRYEKHRLRIGGDLGHVDKDRSGLNRRLIGEEDWAKQARAEIELIRLTNHAKELEGLTKRRRTGELKRRIAEGPRDPWRATQHGPMREVILTVNRKWFDAGEQERNAEGLTPREQAFEDLAKKWLRENFGADCVHARADLDEEAYHIHAVILPRAETKDGRQMLQPSKHPLIRHYEAGQDSVGDWFADLGLVRGERRKQAFRDAMAHNELLQRDIDKGIPDVFLPEPAEMPEYRQHVSPRKWRKAQERALAEREKVATVRESRVSQREQSVLARKDRLAERETVVETREAEVVKREAKASEMQEVARVMIDVATKVSKGDLEVVERIDPAAKASSDPKQIARKHATSIFGRALTKLRGDAREEARAELSDAFEEIKAADEEIVRVTALLPQSAREAIAKARRSLSGRIFGLTQAAKRQFTNRRDEKDQR
ncbi:plasmid recombination protein [uncultured Paracoccus sp.]|uniref:plasmid recombination protein n=1 Tax=uncultured Paracoccus sp. TaxID=189685 RepID=UPI0026158369|nr:plasmid recombination protein [uncultured Paracoccus sp.]